jgi:hypothetical protein
MFRAIKGPIRVALLLAICPILISCSDDNPTDPGDPGGGGDPRVQGVINALSPVLQQGYLGAYASLLGAPLVGSQTCVPVEGACETGSAEWCPAEGGGTVNFSDCLNSGVTANGSIQIAGNEFAGQATFNTTFNDVSVQGQIIYSFDLDTGCLVESYSGFVITSPDGTYNLNGSVEYCLAGTAVSAVQQEPIVPSSGELSIEIPREGQESLWVTMTISPEPPGAFGLNLYDGDINEFVLECTGNLLTLQLNCGPYTGEF